MKGSELLKMMESGKAIMGTEKTIKSIKLGRIDRVLVASNAADSTLSELKRYQGISEFRIEKVDATNDELGAMCKRRHAISVLGVLK
ncbi:ribosomal L7Ae/L30e/S12e/Gadd45 family protein [Candidatus Woesearchaeota archaeon]|nr:ribosomal L7Ae/L30e/S12e/Gadd45 family protein [Candidatus Woesearchaeota archaeon]